MINGELIHGEVICTLNPDALLNGYTIDNIIRTLETVKSLSFPEYFNLYIKKDGDVYKIYGSRNGSIKGE